MVWSDQVRSAVCRQAAQRAADRERREKHRQLEEERERVRWDHSTQFRLTTLFCRQQLREKYNLAKPVSLEEPEPESESEEETDSEEESEAVDLEQLQREQQQQEKLEKLSSE